MNVDWRWIHNISIKIMPVLVSSVIIQCLNIPTKNESEQVEGKLLSILFPLFVARGNEVTAPCPLSLEERANMRSKRSGSGEGESDTSIKN